MRQFIKRLYLGLLALICFQTLLAQDFSNKGKDFWVGYGYHSRFAVGTPLNGQEMVLYIATEQVSNVTVSIPALGYSQTYSNIPANTIFTTNPLPKTGVTDARLNTEGISDKGVRVTSDQPVVAYAHIYNSSISGATLLFPSNTLGKEYYSINFEQRSNENNSYPFFYAIAVDTGTTTIEVTPSANTQTMTAGTTYTYNLKQGQVFNALGVVSGNDGVDLTGTKIRSISTSGSGCKRIAVFSGSAKIYINCASNQGRTADNYMAQALPQTAWGKYYLTAPTKNFELNYYRIAVTDPATVVKMNGAVLTGLVNNFYYQVTSSTPSFIESDKPIMVAQYITTQGACGNANLGDPEIIYLSPVEQNIKTVILNSTPNFNIQQHFINVVIPNTGTAVSSFRLDGAAPSVSFTTHPQNNQFAYAQIPVSAGQHIIHSDSGFNAIAYGYGPAESYGYNAGTNVKDLYQFVSIKNQYATVDFPAGCKGAPLYFNMTLPYQPVKLTWKFNGLFQDTVVNNPVYDSSWVVNGKTIYRYSLNKPYTVLAKGTYPIRLEAENPTAEGCSGIQEIDYDLQIFDPPVAAFNYTTNGCASDSVRFLDSTNTGGREIIKWTWEFGDGSTSSVKNPVHKYTAGGTYASKLSVITDIGCLSDTLQHVVDLDNTPIAAFGLAAPFCAGKDIVFSDASTVSSPTAIAKWNWDFGDGTKLAATDASPFQHRFDTAGTYTVRLLASSPKGCTSAAYIRDVLISPIPVAGFISPEVCLSDPAAPFIDTSKVSSGNVASWSWNFGDANASAANPNTSTAQNPSHRYTNTGAYTASLFITTAAGCVDSVRQSFTVNGSVPQASFTVSQANALCSDGTVTLTNTSQVDFGEIVKLEIYWDNANDVSKMTVDDRPAQGKSYSYKYPEFYTPSTMPYQIRMVAYSGINCLHEVTKSITVLAVPQLVFDTIIPVCSNQPSFTLTQASVINGLPGSGVYTGKGVTSNGAFSPSAAGAGSHMIMYTYSAANGCRDTIGRQAVVYPTPVAQAGPDKAVLEGGSVGLTPTPETGMPVSYYWSPATGLNNTAIASPNASPVNDIIYTMQVTSDKGCQAKDDVAVTVLKKPLVPNAFSPNGDGINDRWDIQYLNTYPGATIEIYNRYGQIVYRGQGYSTPWDGKYNGNYVPAGTYYYIINPKNGRSQMAGFVDVLR